MPPRILPVAGTRYGKWTATGEFDGDTWKCLCDCGAVAWPKSTHLKGRRSTRCRKCAGRTHGLIKSKLYMLWTGIKTRTGRPSSKAYPGYGGRGVGFHAEWENDFVAFADHILEYLGPPHSLEHTLDRERNEEGYVPGNLRWALPRLQARNRRDNRWITIGGETLCATDWCVRAGITLSCAHYRVNDLGWDWERAVTTPPLFRNRKNQINV